MSDEGTVADRRARGLATRRKVLGDAYVDRALGSATDIDKRFQDWATECAWGAVWSRPGLALRDRSLLVCAITAALGRWEEFELHARSAVHSGATDEEIAEALLHVAVYAGAPCANTGFKILRALHANRREGA